MCVTLTTKFSCGCAPKTGTLNCGKFYRSLPCTPTHHHQTHPGLCHDHRRPPPGAQAPRGVQRKLRLAAAKRLAKEREKRVKGSRRVHTEEVEDTHATAEGNGEEGKETENASIVSDWIGDGRVATDWITRVNRAVDERLNLDRKLSRAVAASANGNGTSGGDGSANEKTRGLSRDEPICID